ncbi:Brp/Blh family beta-carotene 15,15'-dioxygenase [Williamsia sp.]|uniref:Brp/Blh family beta-carotene 15,15'-dioxygenase n=1 Tax=Williamsia sp. TaxID=1872085 RepID=UPI001A358E47|nr:Brp/Blh family beta-carotene 15,15'-dioxygenase [Williamsia sp.]MBJ7291854.1 Brp/Blh family beta-carotene 15,15'-dioxygenase [Williamsia sp.]
MTRVALITGAIVAVLADHLMADATAVHVALIALGLVLGVPHGSVDHLLAADVLAVRAVTATVGYAALAAAAWTVLHWGGALPLALMIVASIVHFGLGEVETMDIPFGTSVFRRTALLLTGAGALVLPLARGGPGWDETLRTLSPSLADLFSSGTIRFVLIGIWAASALVSAHLLVVERRWLILVDLAVIGVVGSVVAPLVAFALWFGLWHGPRHIARLVARELADDRRSSTTRQAWMATIRHAVPATLGAYATLAAVVGVVVGYGSTTGAVAMAIVVLLALTAPHMIVVAAMDSAAHRRRRRVDTTPERPPRASRVSVTG